MKTKNIFKALAVAMLLPAMLLTTACSNDDFTANNDNNVTTAKQGYTLPVTVNVTREGDATMRATYTDNGNGTGSLGFSAGDQLFVFGSDLTVGMVGMFQGTLTWQSGGTFSGTLTTENSYGGTAQALLESADFASARLLPADYDDYDYFYFNPVTGFLDTDYTKAFATSKATAVAQFSLEEAKSYSSGFALKPRNAILNFTISGLTPGSHNVEVFGISGAVTANGSGVATFAVGVDGDTYSENINLLVDDTDYFDLDLYGGTDTPLEAGKIYNITRSAAPTLSLTSPAVGQVIGDDGKNYDYASLPGGVTAVAKICYVSGSNGLALALADEGQMNWSTAISTCAAHTPAFTGGTWKLASKDEWDNMINVAGFATLRDGFTSVGGSNLQESGLYWSSTERNASYARYYSFYAGSWSIDNKDNGNIRVRACLEF